LDDDAAAVAFFVVDLDEEEEDKVDEEGFFCNFCFEGAIAAPLGKSHATHSEAVLSFTRVQIVHDHEESDDDAGGSDMISFCSPSISISISISSSSSSSPTPTTTTNLSRTNSHGLKQAAKK
jgi:hypothetical protein